VHDFKRELEPTSAKGEREMGGPIHKCQAWARAYREKRSHKHAT